MSDIEQRLREQGDIEERLRLPISESMFVRRSDMLRALFAERAEAADTIASLRSKLEEAEGARGSALVATPPAEQHPDDIAVDSFAKAMKAKLKWEREQRSRGGWQAMSAADLSRILYEHLPKGDPVDVANLSMMLHQNGQQIETPPAEPVVACKECDGTGFKDKNGARLTIARTACGACAGSGYVAALAAKEGRS